MQALSGRGRRHNYWTYQKSSEMTLTCCSWARYAVPLQAVTSWSCSIWLLPLDVAFSIATSIACRLCRWSSTWCVGTIGAYGCVVGAGSAIQRATMRRTWAPDCRSTEATCSEPMPRTLTSPMCRMWSPLRSLPSWKMKDQVKGCNFYARKYSTWIGAGTWGRCSRLLAHCLWWSCRHQYPLKKT